MVFTFFFFDYYDLSAWWLHSVWSEKSSKIGVSRWKIKINGTYIQRADDTAQKYNATDIISVIFQKYVIVIEKLNIFKSE